MVTRRAKITGIGDKNDGEPTIDTASPNSSIRGHPTDIYNNETHAMISKPLKIITGFVGVASVCTFIIGLAHSISVGSAGFLGGLPFTIIIIAVLSMVVYDYWDQCLKNRSDDE